MENKIYNKNKLPPLTPDGWWSRFDANWKDILQLFMAWAPALVESTKKMKQDRNPKIVGNLHALWTEANKSEMTKPAKPPFRVIIWKNASLALEFINFSKGVL